MIERFDYKHGETTENDIIEYILRLLTEYPGQPNTAVSVYCHIVGQPFDNTEMIDKVVEKLLKYDLAQTDLNVHGVVKITNKGRDVYRKGGFAKFSETQQQIENQEKTNKDYKGQLEVLKLELETDKLKYEKTIRELTEENHQLINFNQKSQKLRNIKDFALWILPPIAWLLSHYHVFENMLKWTLKLLT